MESLLYYEMEQPPFERRLLGNVFTLSKSNLDDIMSRKIIPIPAVTSSFPVLKLFTTVKVFGNEILTGSDSSITLPKQYYDFRKQQAKEVGFWYVQGEKPCIESCIIQHEFSYEAATIESVI